jgi:hypothetical protein
MAVIFFLMVGGIQDEVEGETFFPCCFFINKRKEAEKLMEKEE